MNSFEIGDIVTLKEWEKHSDWQSHRGQEGVIVTLDPSNRYPFGIKWKDGRISGAPASNLIKSKEKLNREKLDRMKSILKEFKESEVDHKFTHL